MKSPPKSKFLQLFERDQGRCVYCGLDLKADYDRFMMATEDHLVATSKGGTKTMANCILSCTVCNRLKSDFVPVPAIDPVKNRRDYVTAVRAHIMKRRSDRMKEFMQVTHPGLGDYQ